MVKKILVVLLSLGVISWGIWYVRNLNAGQLSVGGENNQATSSVTDVNDATVTPESDLLKSESLKIVSRPLPVGATSLYVSKLNEAIDLIKANYNYANPWYDLASYRKISGDYQGAIEALLFLAKIRPSDYVAYHNLGYIYAFQLGNYPKGEEYFLKSIENNSENVDAYVQLATIYQFHDAKNAKLAEDILLEGIKANPKDLSLLINLARYYEDNGNISSAKIYLQKALVLSPENSSIKEELNSLGN